MGSEMCIRDSPRNVPRNLSLVHWQAICIRSCKKYDIHIVVYQRASCTLNNIMAKTPAARGCCMTTPAFATRITFSIEASKTNALYSNMMSQSFSSPTTTVVWSTSFRLCVTSHYQLANTKSSCVDYFKAQNSMLARLPSVYDAH